MRVMNLGTGTENTVDGTAASCGVSALWGMQGYEPRHLVDQVLKERQGQDKSIREAFVVFSDVDYPGAGHRGGRRLAEYIRENKIGTIIESETRMNPNTGNHIKVWVWSPPHESLRPEDKYLPKQGHKRVFTGDKRFIRYATPDAMGRVELDKSIGEYVA